MSGLKIFSENILCLSNQLSYCNFQLYFQKKIKKHSFTYHNNKVDPIYPNSILILQKKEKNQCDCNITGKNITINGEGQKYVCHTFYDFSQKEFTELKFCKKHDNIKHDIEDSQDKDLLCCDYLKNDNVILFINLIKKIRTILTKVFILKYYDKNKLKAFCQKYQYKEDQFLEKLINNENLLDDLSQLVKDNVELDPKKINQLKNNNKTNTDTTTTEIPKTIKEKSSETITTTTEIPKTIKEKSSDFSTKVLIFISIITIVGIVIYGLKNIMIK